MNNIDEALKIELLLERTDLDSVTEFEKRLIKTYDNIRLALLKEDLTDFNRARLTAFLSKVTQKLKEDYPQLVDLIRQDVKEWGEISYNASTQALADGLDKGLPEVAMTFASLNETAVKRVLDNSMIVQGLPIAEQVPALQRQHIERTRQVIASGIMNGVPTKEITAELRTVFDNFAKRKVEALARTTIQTALNEANNESYRQFDTVINNAIYVATLDTRTTPYCNAMNGTTWKRKKGETLNQFKNRVTNPKGEKSKGRSPQTPTHWGCRSKLMYTTKEFYEDWQKDSQLAVTRDTEKVTKHRDGTTSRPFKIKDSERLKTTNKNFEYAKWFDNRATDDFKRFYLGEKRYKLYKEGNLSYNELIDTETYRFKSIKEVKNAPK